MAKELTDKQKASCDEYLVDFNATRVAIRADYSEKTANRIASQTLSKLDIAYCVERFGEINKGHKASTRPNWAEIISRYDRVERTLGKEKLSAQCPMKKSDVKDTQRN